jgi:hypothetical protein
MNFFDNLVLGGRRFEPRKAGSSGTTRFTLLDVLQTFNSQTILELDSDARAAPSGKLRPDTERKLKVSLLDVLSDHALPADAWFEVLQTAPNGDLSKVRILAHSADGAVVGKLEMLLGRRTYDHYFAEDPVLQQLQR